MVRPTSLDFSCAKRTPSVLRVSMLARAGLGINKPNLDSKVATSHNCNNHMGPETRKLEISLSFNSATARSSCWCRVPKINLAKLMFRPS